MSIHTVCPFTLSRGELMPCREEIGKKDGLPYFASWVLTCAFNTFRPCE